MDYWVKIVTIFKRLISSYLTIILLTMFWSIFITIKLNFLNKNFNDIISVDKKAINFSRELMDSMLTQMSFEEKYIISNDYDFYKRFCEIGIYFITIADKLEKIFDKSGNKEIISDVKQNYSLFLKKASILSGKYTHKEFANYEKEKEIIIKNIKSKLKEIKDTSKIEIEKKIQNAGIITFQLMEISAIIAATAIVASLIISFFITRSINRPIMLLHDKTKEIGKGKFGEPLAISSPPEIMELSNAFNFMCERLQELDDMKIDIVSHVSHQLRSPLTVIKEASSMLIEDIFKSLPEKQHELYSLISDECERLISTVNRILDLSRMEAGMVDYNFKPVCLKSLVQRVVIKLGPVIQKKQINLQKNISSNNQKIVMDEEKISVVLENLLHNAIKYTPDRGKIDITVSKHDKNKMTVAVKDTGCGILQEDLIRIFEKFKRIDSGWATARGTGLGLSIAKHIISAHGGIIWAESEINKGSIFFFQLPLS